MYVGYIAFSHAYNGKDICGLHLAPLAVNPQYQKQGIGSEMLRFALRQDVIKNMPIYVLGDTAFYQKFGFEPCSQPVCPFTKNNANFLALRNPPSVNFTVGYEPEFKKGAK
jgi:putative acetyltransferase